MASTIETMLDRFFGPGKRGAANRRPLLTRAIRLAGPVVEWCQSELRTSADRALFAEWLLCVDANPFMDRSSPLLPHVGVRWSVLGEPATLRVIYHVDPALNMVKVLSCAQVQD